MGRSRLKGLKPAKNVGAKNAALIESLIEQVEGVKGRSVVFFESQFREEVKKKLQPRLTEIFYRASSHRKSHNTKEMLK